MSLQLIKLLRLAVIALLVAAAPVVFADYKTPDQLLKDDGFVKVGNALLLETDAKLSDALREIHRGESQLQAYTSKRQAIEADITKAQATISGLRGNVETLNEKLGQTPDPRAYNAVIGEINSNNKNIDDGMKYVFQRQADLTKLVAPTDNIAKTIDLADAMDVAAKRYDELAADDGVKQALATINDGPLKYHLGPSPQFKQQLPHMRMQRDKFKTASIKFEIKGGVPHVTATLNGSASIPMVVDSGASVVTISASVAKQAGVAPKKEDGQVTLVVANGKQVTANLATIATLQVGQFTVKNVKCAILPGDLGEIDCLLGGTFLRNFVYQMDLAAGVLHLSPISASATAAPAASGSAAPTSAPASAAPVLSISAMIDGADDVKITRDGLTWSHKSAAWATEILVNAQPWPAKTQSTLPATAPLNFLHDADFSKAHLTEKSGRGTVTMETSAESLAIHFIDGGRGADKYSVTIAFAAKD